MKTGTVREMMHVAGACLEHPGTHSIWSERHGRYVCSTTPEGQEALEQITPQAIQAHPHLPPPYKWAVAVSGVGTLLFIALCLVLSLIAGRNPPPLFEKLIMGFFDLAKIGFGAIAGLVGKSKLLETGNAT